MVVREKVERLFCYTNIFMLWPNQTHLIGMRLTVPTVLNKSVGCLFPYNVCNNQDIENIKGLSSKFFVGYKALQSFYSYFLNKKKNKFLFLAHIFTWIGAQCP